MVGTPLARRPSDGHHVETGGTFQQPVTLQEGHGQPRQPALLVIVDGLGGMAGVVRLPRLDLDKNDRIAIERHRDRVRPAQNGRCGRGFCSRGGEDIGRQPPRRAGRGSSSGKNRSTPTGNDLPQVHGMSRSWDEPPDRPVGERSIFRREDIGRKPGPVPFPPPADAASAATPAATSRRSCGVP